MYQDDLAKLSRDELIALGLALAAQIEVLAAQITELARRVAELEAKLGQPPKTTLTIPRYRPSQGSAKPTAPNWRAAEEAQVPTRRLPGAGRQSGPDCREPRRALPALRARVAPG